MKVYLAVAARTGALPPALGGVTAHAAEMALLPECGPWRPGEWSRDGRTRLLVWSNEPEDPRLPPPLTTGGDRALGVPGYLGDLGDLERLLRAGDPGACMDDLAGVFGVFRASEDGFVAATSINRVHPVYMASAAGGIELAGNRAILVHLATRALDHPGRQPPVSYDVPALQSLVRSGFFMNDDTPFEGVRALPAHTTLEVRGDARRIATRPAPEPTAPPRGRRARRALTRDLADAVMNAVAPLRAFSEPITLQLSGGRDSRLIAAALHAAGIPFHAMTRRVPEHPDVVLGARVARLLDAPHRIAAPTRHAGGEELIAHPLVRAWNIIRASEGQVSVHNNVAAPRSFRIAPTLMGWGGEQLRGGYLAMVFKAVALPSGPAMVRKVKVFFTDHAELLTDVANQRARGDLALWADRAAEDPARVLDDLYLHYRTGRWVSALAGAVWATKPPITPLLDSALTRQALETAAPWRRSERPMHDVISLLAPPLARLPLANAAWRYQTEKRRLPFQRPAPAASGAGRPTFDWRFQPDPPLIDIVRQQILDGPPALFEIVDRARMEALLQTYPLQQAKLVWHTYTASVLLSGAWLSAPPTLPDIEVSPPADSTRSSHVRP